MWLSMILLSWWRNIFLYIREIAGKSRKISLLSGSPKAKRSKYKLVETTPTFYEAGVAFVFLTSFCIFAKV